MKPRFSFGVISFASMVFWGTVLLSIFAPVPAFAKTTDPDKVPSMGAKPNHEKIGNLELSNIDSSEQRRIEVQNFIDKLPSDCFYGWVETKLSKKISITRKKLYTFFYGKRVSGQSPIFFLNGGPSTSSWSYAQNLLQQEGWKDQPFVYFDQLGTGGSSPYPTVDGASSLAQLNQFADFGTQAFIDSINEINTALQGSRARFRVFTHSFGGVIAMRLLEQPLNKKVIALFAHAPLPCFETQPGEVMRARIDSQVRNWKDYVTRFPQDEGVPQAMLDWLNANSEIQEQARNSVALAHPEFAKLAYDANAIVGSLAMELGSDFQHLHERLSSFDKNKKLAAGEVTDLINAYLVRVYLNELAARDYIVHREVTPGLTRREGVKLAEASLPAVIQVISEVNVYPHIGDVSGKLDQLIMHGNVSPIDMHRARLNMEAKHAPKITIYSYKADSTVAPANVQSTVNALGDKVIYKSENEGGHSSFVQNKMALSDLIESAKLK